MNKKNISMPEIIYPVVKVNNRYYLNPLPVYNIFSIADNSLPGITSSFQAWIEYHIEPTHKSAVEFYIEILNTKQPNKAPGLHIALSDSNRVEGIIDLYTPSSISFIEIAPWNRTTRPYFLGLGTQLRVLAIKKLINIFGHQLYSTENIHRVICLGHRDAREDVFDWQNINKVQIEKYLSRTNRRLTKQLQFFPQIVAK